MFIMHLPGVTTTGVDGKALCYVMLRAASSGKYRMLILAIPRGWWGAAKWTELRMNWSPLKTAYSYEYKMDAGKISTFTVAKKEWMNAIRPTGIEHKFGGNMFDSLERLLEK